MNVLERMKAAGYDPELAREVRGPGTMECDQVEVTFLKCRPWQYGPEAVCVTGVACVLFTDGSVRPAPGWYADDTVTMYFEADKVSFKIHPLPDRIRV